ncbi:MAG: hypothetical protein NTNFB01_17740 [Nitrospira sp.]
MAENEDGPPIVDVADSIVNEQDRDRMLQTVQRNALLHDDLKKEVKKHWPFQWPFREKV